MKLNTKLNQQNYINHIAFVIDKSGSIRNARLEDSIIEAFDSQVNNLKTRALESGQETRVSLYLFNEDIECLCFDVDISKVPSLSRAYRASGDTAMIDAMFKTIDDLSKINTIYGDHAFLVYCLTDGENRINNNLSGRLNKEITNLPENWTVACLVPNQNGVYEAKKFGFPAQNIQVWETTKKGVETASRKMSFATDTYYTSRAKGIRGTKTLFNLDASNLNTTKVKKNLQELNHREYELLPVHNDAKIKDYVEAFLGEYRVGSAYYEVMKPETIQANKQLAVQDKLNGKIYFGLNARDILGLPNYEVKVSPLNYGKYRIFCQSNSVNRNLVRGTQLLVLK